MGTECECTYRCDLCGAVLPPLEGPYAPASRARFPLWELRIKRPEGPHAQGGGAGRPTNGRIALPWGSGVEREICERCAKALGRLVGVEIETSEESERRAQAQREAKIGDEARSILGELVKWLTEAKSPRRPTDALAKVKEIVARWDLPF